MKKQKAKKAVQRKRKGSFFKFADSVMAPESIKRSEKKAKVQIELAKLRESLGVNQSSVPGFTQASISKIEGRSDIKLSTLIQYANSLNMNIEIRALPKGDHSKEDEIELLKTGS